MTHLTRATTYGDFYHMASALPGESSSYEVVSTLLSRLKAPTASNLARKRIISRNPVQVSKRSKATVHDEPKISPACQVKNESLTVYKCKLFCSACRELLSVKKRTANSILLV